MTDIADTMVALYGPNAAQLARRWADRSSSSASIWRDVAEELSGDPRALAPRTGRFIGAPPPETAHGAEIGDRRLRLEGLHLQVRERLDEGRDRFSGPHSLFEPGASVEEAARRLPALARLAARFSELRACVGLEAASATAQVVRDVVAGYGRAEDEVEEDLQARFQIPAAQGGRLALLAYALATALVGDPARTEPVLVRTSSRRNGPFVGLLIERIGAGPGVLTREGEGLRIAQALASDAGALLETPRTRKGGSAVLLTLAATGEPRSARDRDG